MKLTDKGIAALKPRAERYEVFDGDGFGVRVTPNGAKSFILVYRFDGRARRLTLGRYGQRPNMSLADANLAAAEARKKLERGIDPGAEHVAERIAEREAMTVNELCDEYLEKWAKPRKRSADQDERILAKDVRPKWGKRKAASIKRSDVVALLDEVVARGAPVMANRLLATLRRMFNFAVPRDIVEINPCWKVEAPGDESPRDRVLDDAELVAFFRGLRKSDMSRPVQLALVLTLATGARSGEVVRAEDRRINEAEATWLIPAAEAKAGRGQLVPLSPFALAVIREARALAKPKEGREASPWLFPSRVGGGAVPLTQRALAHAIRDNASAFGIDPFAPHDLRRSTATGLRRLGTSRFVVERILAHVDGSTAGVHYDLYDALPEKREALNAWGERLEALMGKAATDGPTRANSANSAERSAEEGGVHVAA